MRASIVLCTYNGQDYLDEQLESIIASMRPQDELVVSDDGSVDDTVAIVRTLAQEDDRVRLVAGPRQGVMENFSQALALVSGDVVFLADQDDIWSPRKVDRVVSIFEESPDVLGVVHDVRVVDGSLNEIAPSYFELRGSGPGLLKNFYKNGYLGTAMAFRASLLPHVLPIPRTATMHDVWIGVNVEVFGRGCFLREELGLYRRHGANQTDLFAGSARSILRKRARMAALTARQLVRARLASRERAIR